MGTGTGGPRLAGFFVAGAWARRRAVIVAAHARRVSYSRHRDFAKGWAGPRYRKV